MYYNLHGSAYWTIQNENSNNLPGYQYFLSGVPETNDSAATIEIESGRKLLLTNIITGYQKVQKTAISPFRQMLSAFDRDCFDANELYIIGYSFGDEHINDIIRNARKYNSDLEIILINPTFNDEQFMFDFILHWGSVRGMIYKNNGKDEIISPDYKVRVLQKRFGEFLTQQ
ncbi:MAG: SIR2 family protein [Bacteroidia bacterium]|nr:SIR2 family protein [Bacteroidia bacterium]